MEKPNSDIDFNLLWKLLSGCFAMGANSIHGPSHWRRVEENGLLIARRTGADIIVVRLFAVFHDSKRINEEIDKDHGLRGAEYAKRLRKTCIPISDKRFHLLYKACADHDIVLRSADPTIGTCWDADRIDLDRVGIIPSTRFISTAAGRKIVSAGGRLL